MPEYAPRKELPLTRRFRGQRVVVGPRAKDALWLAYVDGHGKGQRQDYFVFTPTPHSRWRTTTMSEMLHRARVAGYWDGSNGKLRTKAAVLAHVFDAKELGR